MLKGVFEVRLMEYIIISLHRHIYVGGSLQIFSPMFAKLVSSSSGPWIILQLVLSALELAILSCTKLLCQFTGEINYLHPSFSAYKMPAVKKFLKMP
jgi:hypothetical protein